MNRKRFALLVVIVFITCVAALLLKSIKTPDQIESAGVDKLAISELISNLGSEDETVRTSSISALVEVKELAVPALIEAMHRENWWIRCNAAATLGKIGQPYTIPAVPTLVESLGDSNYAVRGYSAEALGIIGESGNDVISALIDTFTDEKPWVQGKAINALAQIGETTMSKLFIALRSKNWRVRLNASYALSSIGKPAIPGLIDAMKQEESFYPDEPTKALTLIGEPAVPALIPLLNNKNSFVRAKAVVALFKISEFNAKRAAAAVPALTKVLGDEDVHVREFAANVLKHIRC